MKKTNNKELFSMIKVALIGCGKISSGHVKAFETIEDAAIVAACDLAEQSLNAVCEKTGAKPYTDYKKMIDELKDEIDLAIITLPHGLHGEATCYCAERGVDVFLEKPMGLDSEDCRNMIECCKKCGVMLWVGHLQRYMPINVFAKELIDSGEYGELVGFTETRNGEYFTESRPRWFTTKAMSGGGISINLGAHTLDKLKYFTGANIKTIFGGIHMHEGSDCEDAVQAFIEMDNGVVGTMNLIGYTSAHAYDTILYLTNGEIRIRSEIGNSVEYCKKGEPFQLKECDHVPGMTYQMQDVIRVIRDGSRKPVVTGEYGLDIIHAVKRIYKEEQ